MKSTSLSTIFTELIEALIDSDLAALRKIALSENHDLIQSVFIEQKTLGEFLAYCHENIADVDIQQVGWMMIARAEVGLAWYRNWYEMVYRDPSSDEPGAVIGTD